MDFNAVVVGGGHTGIEASLALARMGFETLLITQNLDVIGKMSCNPAIGGLAKGNLVREIDALGGEMARLIDSTMIQFRILNKSKGPAVQSYRAQADKAAYSLLAKWTLEREKHLHVFQDTVVDIITDTPGRSVAGVVTERGKRFTSSAVVITTGTFMEGKIFIGEYSSSSGRLGEPAALGLGVNLRRLGFKVGRLKTGTPARALRSSLNFDRMEEQPGDNEMFPFSFSNKEVNRPNVSCYITYTNRETHRIIEENIDKSPLYGGKITGVGPRYCPSIEDKVVRFPERQRHQVFVEPEGLSTEEVYLNGISSSLPEDVQEKFLKTVPGFEKIEIMRPGYAVEYDYLNPTQLFPSLETKRIRGLFIAGQTNGTSGYEEAAAQGLVAGINAGLFLQKKPPLILSRAEAYIGVLIDDLVTLGTEEPYRLFTSRAEYRLALRHDTADLRLFEKGYGAGLNNDMQRREYLQKIKELEEVRKLLKERKVHEEDTTHLFALKHHLGESFEQVLRDPKVKIADLARLDEKLAKQKHESLGHVELDVKYEGYIKRQQEQVERFVRMEKKRIPEDFNYDRAVGISAEAREKLKKIRPVSIGQASRIQGVRSADVAVLLVHLKKGA
ncbi:MAG: tRNA uridine-5-carboxymethylaminomethyl(34) synthesis enzyme MnmG [Spirochaetales bacterium]|nr:tRNA uridine-5-carboxymethylaminomethyl(34) synthesis enzyme MnmG [Spirochaetales bacterium]